MTTSTSLQPLDQAKVTVEYGYSAPERDINVGARVEIVAVYIGGALVEPSYFSEETLNRWADAIAEEVAEDADIADLVSRPLTDDDIEEMYRRAA
jgi:hypothetical protein